MNTLHLCSSLLKGAMQTVLQCNSHSCARQHSSFEPLSDDDDVTLHPLIIIPCFAVDIRRCGVRFTARSLHVCSCDVQLWWMLIICASVWQQWCTIVMLTPVCFLLPLVAFYPVTALKKLPFMRNRSKEKDRVKAVYRRSMCKTPDSPHPPCSSLLPPWSHHSTTHFTHMPCPHPLVTATACHGY